jgi:hypothetical protein
MGRDSKESAKDLQQANYACPVPEHGGPSPWGEGSFSTSTIICKGATPERTVAGADCAASGQSQGECGSQCARCQIGGRVCSRRSLPPVHMWHHTVRLKRTFPLMRSGEMICAYVLYAVLYEGDMSGITSGPSPIRFPADTLASILHAARWLSSSTLRGQGHASWA